MFLRSGSSRSMGKSIAFMNEPKKLKKFTPQPLKVCGLTFAPAQMVTCLAIDNGRLFAGDIRLWSLLCLRNLHSCCI